MATLFISSSSVTIYFIARVVVKIDKLSRKLIRPGLVLIKRDSGFLDRANSLPISILELVKTVEFSTLNVERAFVSFPVWLTKMLSLWVQSSNLFFEINESV